MQIELVNGGYRIGPTTGTPSPTPNAAPGAPLTVSPVSRQVRDSVRLEAISLEKVRSDRPEAAKARERIEAHLVAGKVNQPINFSPAPAPPLHQAVARAYFQHQADPAAMNAAEVRRQVDTQA